MSEEVKKQKARERAKRYYEKNKEKILKRQKEYVKKRYMEDEEFRKKVKEKNKNYFISNPEKVREIKRKSQHKYITKKRLNGELPLTQKMLNEQLQQENQQLKKKLNKAIEMLIEYHMPCDIDEFWNKNIDYCMENCSVDEEVYKKCWLRYIEQELENDS